MGLRLITWLDRYFPFHLRIISGMTLVKHQKAGSLGPWRVSWRFMAYDRVVVTADPLFHYLVRAIILVRDLYFLRHTVPYDIGFLDTPEGARFSYKDWTWNPVATWRKRLAAGWGWHSVTLSVLRTATG